MVIPSSRLRKTIAEFGYFPEQPLRPVIRVSYRRYRFNEMLTGTRVSLDYTIRSSLVIPDIGHREREVRLAGGVIEVKGPEMELPVTLRKMSLLDTDWSRFSKYGNCIDSHLSFPGSAAGFSPSGKILEL